MDRSIRAWARLRRTDPFVNIIHGGLNVMFSLGCFSVAWCWRLWGLEGKGGPVFPKQQFMLYQR